MTLAIKASLFTNPTIFRRFTVKRTDAKDNEKNDDIPECKQEYDGLLSVTEGSGVLSSERCKIVTREKESMSAYRYDELKTMLDSLFFSSHSVAKYYVSYLDDEGIC
jgi:hypothetical protein